MEKNNIVVVLYLHKQRKEIDLEIPLDITANELIIGMNQAFHLNIDTSDLSQCYLKTENPITFLRGNKTLGEYELHNGTCIHFTQ